MLETLHVLFIYIAKMAENQTVHVRERFFQSENVVQFVQEPFVDVRHLPDFINAVSSMKGS